MNVLLLNIESQEFINNNLNSDLTTLLLKGTSLEKIETVELINQIEAKKKSQKKLPTWFNQLNIYFPSKLNIEQTSSEISAEYKSSLMEGLTIIDVTGGFGVDSFYFSKRFEQVTHCEINVELSEIVNHNFKQLKVENVEVIPGDGLKYLKALKQQFDWIYVDPSRRHDSKGKVFFLRDCLPNIPESLDALFQFSKKIMIKTSPLLDITVGISELKYVKTIHIVAINNEVKELLWILEKGFNSDINIETVNIKPENNEDFSYQLSQESKVNIQFGLPLAYLYEPNSAILKSGAFKTLASQFDLFKLHQHSHLYTNEILISFPGRRFKILETFLYNKNGLKKYGITKANITTRNFPETVEQLRKKYKIADGGSCFLFFTTNSNNEKIVISCIKAE